MGRGKVPSGDRLVHTYRRRIRSGFALRLCLSNTRPSDHDVVLWEIAKIFVNKLYSNQNPSREEQPSGVYPVPRLRQRLREMGICRGVGFWPMANKHCPEERRDGGENMGRARLDMVREGPEDAPCSRNDPSSSVPLSFCPCNIP